MKHFTFILVVIAILLRFINLGKPIADWHSHRQADTASVTRDYIKNGLNFTNLTLPTYHDRSSLQSGIENPLGLRLVEYPIYNLISYGLYKLIHVFLPPFTVETSSRLISIAAWLISTLFIYRFTQKRFKNRFLSLLTSGYFLFLPHGVFYSRSILPEPTAILFLILTLYYFPSTLLLSTLFLALGLLVKPYIALLLFPYITYESILYLKKAYLPSQQIAKLVQPLIKLLLFLILSTLPLLLWRLWINQHPEGIPKSDWLFNNSDQPWLPQWWHGYNLTFLNKLIAFRPHWFKWLFYERLVKLILGWTLAVPFLMSFVPRLLKIKINFADKTPFLLFLGIILYFIVVAGGNIRHDYYQILTIPYVSIILGIGTYYLALVLNSKFKKRTAATITAILVLFSFYYSANMVKPFYNINNPSMIQAGQFADKILPQNSIVIAPYNGDTSFLYQTKRPGYPLNIENFNLLYNLYPGTPVYLVSINFDQYTNRLKSKYPTVYQTSSFIIVNLSQP